jgi:hypothetical protein
LSCLAPQHQQLLPFALGELDATACAALLEHVAICPSCSKELDLLADVTAVASHARPAAAPRGSALLRRAPRIAAVAVAAFFVLGVLDQLMDSGPDKPHFAELADRSVPPFLVTDVDASDTPWGDEFESAMESWDRADFAEVDRALSKFLDVHPDHAPARLFRGVARRELGRLVDARADLKLVAEGSQGSLRDQALWLLANVCLQSDLASEANGALDQLAAVDGEYTERARALRARVDLVH